MVATKDKKPRARRNNGAATKAKTTRAKKAGAKSAKGSVSNEERYNMVAEAAYYLAERTGFDPAKSMDNWLEAERQIAAKLG